MKVLLINSVCGIRSTGRICTDIATVLEQQGHTCKIGYGRETVPEQFQKYAVRIGTNSSVKVDALKTRLLDNAGFNSYFATKKFLQWVKEYDPDIVHLHNIHGYYINIKLLFEYLRDAGKPVVWTLHDCWSFTGHCVHFELIGCDKWRKGCHNCPRTKAYPSSLGYDRSKKNYAQKKAYFTAVKNMTIATPSRWLGDLVKQSYLGDCDVLTIPNGIDLDVFKPTEGTFREEYGLQDKKIVLAVASAWSVNKGLKDLYRLADMLGEDYRVVIVGLKPEQMSDVPANVTGITRTNNVQQLAHLYTTADVFVNPTYQDTYPTVNLEAQACGTPVITYRSGGSPESVPPEQVVPQGDLETMCQAIKSLDYKVLEADFSAEASFSKYVELYAQKYTNS